MIEKIDSELPPSPGMQELLDAIPEQVVDPSTIVVPQSATNIPGEYIKIDSAHEAEIRRRAMEELFLREMSKQFYAPTVLTPRQKKARAKAKRAKSARKLQQRLRKA